MSLPRLPNSDGIKKHSTIQFTGYDHTLAARDGSIWDEKNISSDLFPILAPRLPRYKQRKLNKPNGFYCHDGLYWVDGTTFYDNGVSKGTVSNSSKTMASLGRYIMILPDKKVYDTVDGIMQDIESTATVVATFKDGKYSNVDAEANTIYAETSSFDFASYFKAGDAVEISGAADSENNKTLIVREIEGRELRFYPNSFKNNASAATLTIKRSIPDLDFACENENRMWGCKGDTIYASKLGDIFNWNVFDGVATDSYAVDVGSVGDFTGCTSYLGYPCFMKEEKIYKVYGDKPSNYQVMSSASMGTAVGGSKSFAIAGETLFYLSRAGIVAYNGGSPANISAAFGTSRYSEAVGGSDGVKYYVSMREGDKWTLFTYDTRNGLWHKEDDVHVIGFGWNEELYFVDADGNMWMNGNTRTPSGEKESAVESMVEFADFVEYSQYSPRYQANEKGTSKLQMRVELDAGARLHIQMQFDGGRWFDVKTLTATEKRSFYLPIIPRRSDHFRIKLIGKGVWKVYSLVRESYHGSELR